MTLKQTEGESTFSS